MQNHKGPTGFAQLIAVATALLLMIGCGTGVPSRVAPNTYAYVGLSEQSYGVASLGQFQVTSRGALTPLPPGDFQINTEIDPTFSESLIVDPSGKYLFVVGNITRAVSQFVIGADGTITANSVPYVSTPIAPYSMAFTPNGQFAIVTDGISLSTYSLSPTGCLSLVSTLPTSVGLYVVIDPSGRFLYVAEEAYSTISEFEISETGTLTPRVTIASEYLPWMLTFSPKGFLYSVNYGANTITEYSIDASTGAPTKVDTFSTGSVTGYSQPRGIAFDPTGTYAYVANTNENTVSQFVVNAATGVLRRNGPDIPTGPFPIPIGVEPSGRFLFTGNGGDDTLSQFTINTDGRLTSNGIISAGTSNYYPLNIAFAQR